MCYYGYMSINHQYIECSNHNYYNDFPLYIILEDGHICVFSSSNNGQEKLFCFSSQFKKQPSLLEVLGKLLKMEVSLESILSNQDAIKSRLGALRKIQKISYLTLETFKKRFRLWKQNCWHEWKTKLAIPHECRNRANEARATQPKDHADLQGERRNAYWSLSLSARVARRMRKFQAKSLSEKSQNKPNFFCSKKPSRENHVQIPNRVSMPYTGMNTEC